MPAVSGTVAGEGKVSERRAGPLVTAAQPRDLYPEMAVLLDDPPPIDGVLLPKAALSVMVTYSLPLSLLRGPDSGLALRRADVVKCRSLAWLDALKRGRHVGGVLREHDGVDVVLGHLDLRHGGGTHPVH